MAEVTLAGSLALALRYRVIAVDYRGMGGSDKPASGYDKKTMAADIDELVQRLGHRWVDIVGHDMGAADAHAFAVNFPDRTHKVVLLDGVHPGVLFDRMPMLQQPGPQASAIETGRRGGYPWWIAFNQVRGLPERLLEGRARLLIDWVIDYMAGDPSAISHADREIYARAYDSVDAIRASNAWYQAWRQDIADAEQYGPITAPTLVLTTDGSRQRLDARMAGRATDLRVIGVHGSRHFLAEEQPDHVVRALIDFLS
jgi:pimeloyl-ACP methyl ester carboxylesterase